jgi:predicted small metal-binding protein
MHLTFRVERLSGYKFKCKDIGMKDCDFEVKGSTSRDEVMQIATVHAKQAHKMETIPPDVAQKVSSAIKS